MIRLSDSVVAYQGCPQVEVFDHTIQLDDYFNPYNHVYTSDSYGIQQTSQLAGQQPNCYKPDMTERNNMEYRDWYSYMGRSLDYMEGYYRDTIKLECARMENDEGLIVTLEEQEFRFYLKNDRWWVDENGRYLITVGPKVLNINYNGGSLNFSDFSQYFGCRIDVVLVNDLDPNDMLTLECVYGGDIKAHTSDNGVYMTGVSYLPNDEDAEPDGSIVEFIGSADPKDESQPGNDEYDNGIMSEYHVELMIVYGNEEE